MEAASINIPQTSPHENEMKLKQMELEYEGRSIAAHRYNQATDKRILKSEEHNNTYGRSLIRHSVEKVANALVERFQAMESSKAARHAIAYQLLKDTIKPTQAAYLALQVVIGSISTRAPALSTTISIATRIEDEIRLAFLRKADKRAYNRLVESCKNKFNYNRKHDSVIKYTEDLVPIDVKSWTRSQKIHVGTLMIDLIINSVGIIQRDKERLDKRTIEILVPTDATQEFISDHREIAQFMRPFRDPMIVKPLPWVKGKIKGGGYLTHAQRPLLLIKTQDEEQFKAVRKAWMPEVLNAVNLAQFTKWKVNNKILEVAKQIALGASGLGGLPRGEDIPLPPAPIDKDTNEQALIEWKIRTRQIYIDNNKLKSQRIGLNLLLGQAERFKEYETIYFPHHLDTRGRLYSATNGGLSPQGSDLSKALIHFAKPERIGKDGISWFKVHLANLFGVDKVSFADRIQWVNDNQDKLFACSEDPYTNTFWAEADKPFQALAACFELAQIIYHGPNHLTRIPVALDGSCSGLQNLAMALRCEETGKSVNLIPNDKPSDIYTDVANMVTEYLLDSHGIVHCSTQAEAKRKAKEIIAKQLSKKAKKSNAQLLNYIDKVLEGEARKSKHSDEVKELYHRLINSWSWLTFGVTRKTCKRSVMTFPYGSNAYGFSEQLKQDVLYPAFEKENSLLQRGEITDQEFQARFPFEGRGAKAAHFLADILYKAVKSKVKKASEIMEWMQASAKIIAKHNQAIWWKTPLGFPVKQCYFKQSSKKVTTTLGGKVWYASYLDELDEINVKRMANAISPNVVHSLDSSHLMLVVNQAAGDGVRDFALIHDSFGVHANRVPRFFQAIREAFVDLYEENPFIEIREGFIKQAEKHSSERVPELPAEGNLAITQVLNSDFAFA